MSYQLQQLQVLFGMAEGAAFGKVVAVRAETIAIATPAGYREFSARGFVVGDVVKIHGCSLKKLLPGDAVRYV